jgi:hypothetical protein
VIWMLTCPNWRLTYFRFSPALIRGLGVCVPERVESDRPQLRPLANLCELPLVPVVRVDRCALRRAEDVIASTGGLSALWCFNALRTGRGTSTMRVECSVLGVVDEEAWTSTMCRPRSHGRHTPCLDALYDSKTGPSESPEP